MLPCVWHCTHVQQSCPFPCYFGLRAKNTAHLEKKSVHLGIPAGSSPTFGMAGMGMFRLTVRAIELFQEPQDSAVARQANIRLRCGRMASKPTQQHSAKPTTPFLIMVEKCQESRMQRSLDPRSTVPINEPQSPSRVNMSTLIAAFQKRVEPKQPNVRKNTHDSSAIAKGPFTRGHMGVSCFEDVLFGVV